MRIKRLKKKKSAAEGTKYKLNPVDSVVSANQL